MRGWMVATLLGLAASAGAQIAVPEAPLDGAKATSFRDRHFGVRFVVPAGWGFTKKDHEVSTFRLDARTAGARAQVRGVASMEFNPFPRSTLSGALVYYSVEKHAKEAECAAQALDATRGDAVDIGGMTFTHGYDEHGGMCVEGRDEIYTAYRKRACYRFDLELNTFCSEASGAREMTARQMWDVEAQMAGILSTVVLDWEKSGASVVPAPAPPPEEKRVGPRRGTKPARSGF